MSCGASGCWGGANSMRQARRAAWWLQISCDRVLLFSQRFFALHDLVLWLLGSSLLFKAARKCSLSPGPSLLCRWRSGGGPGRGPVAEGKAAGREGSAAEHPA